MSAATRTKRPNPTGDALVARVHRPAQGAIARMADGELLLGTSCGARRLPPSSSPVFLKAGAEGSDVLCAVVERWERYIVIAADLVAAIARKEIPRAVHNGSSITFRFDNGTGRYRIIGLVAEVKQYYLELVASELEPLSLEKLREMAPEQQLEAIAERLPAPPDLADGGVGDFGDGATAVLHGSEPVLPPPATVATRPPRPPKQPKPKKKGASK